MCSNDIEPLCLVVQRIARTTDYVMIDANDRENERYSLLINAQESYDDVIIRDYAALPLKLITFEILSHAAAQKFENRRLSACCRNCR